MLTSHGNLVLPSFAADFEPQLGFIAKLSEAAAALHSAVGTKHWIASGATYVFRDTIERRLLTFTHKRFLCQTLGLDAWQKNIGTYGDAVKLGLDKLGVTNLKRLGFKVSAYLPVGMSHREISRLMFGSFLAPIDELKSVFATTEDALVQLHGVYKELKHVTVVTPLTGEQATEGFKNFPNLEHFVEPKLFDTGAKDFRDRLNADCLLIEVDLFLEECLSSRLESFLKQSLEAAVDITNAVVARLKSLRVKGA